MDDWEKFNKTLLLEKKFFYSYLNMEDVTDADYTNAKRVWKDFEIKVEENIMICMYKAMQYC